MKVSVIMGIYNCASTLQEALDSLYSQTFQDFEVILCDDGSTDQTYQIAASNAQQHPQVRLIRNPQNLGLSAALNRCLALVQGQYVARMDGDDVSLPDRFQKEVDWLDAHPQYAFVSCPIIHFDQNGPFLVGKTLKPEPELKDFAVSSPFCHAPVMVRREAFQSIGGYCEAWYCRQMEDYHLWMQFYLAGHKGYRLSECLYAMRDDVNAARRRHFRRRVNETYVRWLICRNFHLPITSYLYCLRPLVLWALPRPLYMYLHKRSLR